MSGEWKDITPAAFYLEEDQPGRVFRAETKGPPLQYRPIPEFESSNSAMVVVEFEDCVARASIEMYGERAKASGYENPARFAFQARDARFLAVALIKALAEGGDTVAYKLDELLMELRDEHDSSILDEEEPPTDH